VRRFLLIPVFFLLFLVYAMLNRAGSIQSWLELRGDLLEGEERIGALEEENRGLRAEIEVFEGDSIAVERVLREELELARPGEVIVKLPDAAE